MRSSGHIRRFARAFWSSRKVRSTRRLDGGHAIVAPHWWLLGEDPHVPVALLGERGLEVVAWTVDDDDRARMLAAAGVSVIISDDPRRIIEALRRNE